MNRTLHPFVLTAALAFAGSPILRSQPATLAPVARTVSEPGPAGATPPAAEGLPKPAANEPVPEAPADTKPAPPTPALPDQPPITPAPAPRATGGYGMGGISGGMGGGGYGGGGSGMGGGMMSGMGGMGGGGYGGMAGNADNMFNPFMVEWARASTASRQVMPRFWLFAPRERNVLDELGEDLGVFEFLLVRSLGQLGERTEYRMGVPLVVTGQSETAIDYVDGFGALFRLAVSFPLLEAPRPGAAKPETTTDSDWDRARREYLGQPGPAQEDSSPAGPVPYNARLVEGLKGELIASLKYAANLRSVADNEWIAVLVSGAAQMGDKEQAAERNLRERYGLPPGRGIVTSMVPRPTVMTLRVHKADCAALASGQLKPEEFKDKVQVSTFFGGLSEARMPPMAFSGRFMTPTPPGSSALPSANRPAVR